MIILLLELLSTKETVSLKAVDNGLSGLHTVSGER